MKGLLIKDIYVLARQMRMFLLMIAIFACMPGMSTTSFAVVYSAMLPISALAYDERSKWNNLAAMMPYTPRQLVLSKYLLGYGLVLAVGLLSCAATIAISLAKSGALPPFDEFAALMVTVCVGLLFLGINMPLMFKLGVEKGRLVYLCMTVVLVLGASYFGESIVQGLGEKDVAGIAVFGLMPAAAAAINAASIALSIRFYNAKRA